jgi:hypothetical protein
MNLRSRHTSLIAGAALIVLTNAVALGGVAWNRSGEPESELRLGMRELRVTRGGFNRESNGVMLDLVWRTPAMDDKALSMWDYAGGGGRPRWLDDAKLAELGFAAPDMKTYADLQRRRGTSREVLLVLEMDGPARQARLEQVRAKTGEMLSAATTQPVEQAQRNVKQAQEWLRREEGEFSRLFAIDAGLDATALRQRYPDRARYAFVPGRISAAYERKGGNLEMRGYVQGVANDTLNVPYEFRSRLTADSYASPRNRASEELKGAAVTVAFGRRLEPWIVAIDRTDAPKP